MKTLKHSFTLIELLIVIGILSVLVVTILITLNPAEAQKKARDTKRMKDLATLQAIVDQYINDGNVPFCITTCTSWSAGQVKSQPCDNNWLTNLCQYAKTVPTDPLNGVNGNVICGGTVSSPQICNTTQGGNPGFFYAFRMSGSDYKIGSFMESKSSASNTLNDGGNNNWYAEFFSGPAGQNLW